MKLNIKDISDAGVRVERSLDRGDVERLLDASGLALQEGPTRAEMSLRVTRIGETVFVRGAIHGELWTSCSRCLQPAAVRLDEPELKLTFLPPKHVMVEEGEAVELDVEDLDTFTHDGVQVDLGALLREYLLLAVPIAPLCSEECGGVVAETEPSDSGEAEDEASGAAGWKTELERLKSKM